MLTLVCYIVAKPDYSEDKIVVAMVCIFCASIPDSSIELFVFVTGRASSKRKVLFEQQAHDLSSSLSFQPCSTTFSVLTTKF